MTSADVGGQLSPPVGLVRVVTPEGVQHVYGVDEIPPGEFSAELGALHSERSPDRIPVWRTEAGAVVVGDSPTGFRPPSLLRLARWVLAPLCWGGTRGARRLSLVVWRLAHIRTRVRCNPAVDRDRDVPAGYLERRAGEGLLPLLEGIHPITGDQLLTLDVWEIVDLGYGGWRCLGYIRAFAPMTGSLAAQRPQLQWASRLGQAVRSSLSFSIPCPGAFIDRPEDGWRLDTLPILVSGWAMFSRESVVRVEIAADGVCVGRARLGLPRSDVAARCGAPDAPISGWEYLLTADDVPPGAQSLSITGRVHGSAGGELELPEVCVLLDGGRDMSRSHSGGVSANGAVPATANSARRRPAVSGAVQIPADAAVSNGRISPENRPGGGGMRILVFTHSLAYGGAQLYLVELIERLSTRGICCTVVSPLDGPLRLRLEEAGVVVHLSPPPVPWQAEMYEARVAELVTWAAAPGFDLVMVNAIMPFYGVEVANRLGLPSIFAIHESIDPAAYWRAHLVPHDPRVRELLEAALGTASAVVFEAEATRQVFLPYGDSARYLAMPYGIDLAAIATFRDKVARREARSALGLPLDSTILLCLGTLEVRKCQASLARAFSRIAERHPDAILALVGQVDEPWSEPYRIALSQHLVRTGKLNRVRIARLMPDPFVWHAAADVLVCASDNESLPRVILEAMAFERVVVSTEVFGVPEVIEDGVTGYLCPPRDEEALAARLEYVLTHSSEHGPTVAAAHRRVSERHDADGYAAAFEELACALVEDPSVVPSGVI